MLGYSRPRLATAASLTAVAVAGAALGNETVLPTAAIGALLAWQPTRAAATSGGDGNGDWPGRAARAAIVAYSLFMAALSLLISLFLASFAEGFGLTGAFDGDFVRVTINDAHEFGYATCLLLGLQLAGALVLRSRATGRKATAPANAGRTAAGQASA